MGYVANVPLRFGDRTVKPGEAVPVEPGRSYRQLLRLGHISITREAPEPRRRSTGRVSGDGEQ